MSLLDIVSRATDILELPQVAQVVGNGEKNVRQLRELIQVGGDTLTRMRDSEGDGWPVLERIHEFTTVQDQAEYDLPQDFKSFTVDTAWQRDRYWKARGSLNGRQWQRIRNRQSTTGYNVFRIFRTQEALDTPPIKGVAQNTLNKFHIEPAPGEGLVWVFEYKSNGWWINSGGTAVTKRYQADTDESLFGDDMHVLDVVWRWKQANGLQFAADLAVFEDQRDQAFAQDSAKEPIQIGRDRRYWGNSDESDVEWCY